MYCGCGEGAKEPVRLQITGCADIWVSRRRDRGIPGTRGWGRTVCLRHTLSCCRPLNFTSVLELGGRQWHIQYGHCHRSRLWWGRGGHAPPPENASPLHSSLPQGLCACLPLPGEGSPRVASCSVFWSQLRCHWGGEACPNPSSAPLCFISLFISIMALSTIHKWQVYLFVYLPFVCLPHWSLGSMRWKHCRSLSAPCAQHLMVHLAYRRSSWTAVCLDGG